MTRGHLAILLAMPLLACGGTPTDGSPPVTLTPIHLAPPSIEGTAREQELLRVNAEAWRWPSGAGVTHAYAWQRCDAAGESCADLDGATGSTYLLTVDDVGSRMRLRLRATLPNAPTVSLSAPTDVVRRAIPRSLTSPSISGTQREGETLSASEGAWSGYITGFDFAWERCDAGGGCVTVSTGGSSYLLTPADVGSSIRVRVTARGDGVDVAALSEPTGWIAARPPVAEVAPEISGTPITGELLSGSTGTFQGTAPMTHAYQWLRCTPIGDGCVEISGATEATYRLSAPDVGGTVRLRVTASNSAGSGEATSAPSAPIAGQSLLFDDFDVGASAGQPPAGWNVQQPAGTGVQVVSSATQAPQTPPFSLRLSDDSASGRPEIYRALAGRVPSGSATVRVRVNALSRAPIGIQLRTEAGGFLAAVLLSSNGYAGHDVGAGTVDSAVRWAAATWLPLRIDWFEDDTFDAYLGGARFVRRVPFSVAGDPGRLVVTVGHGPATGREAFVDSISVDELAARDDFERNALGSAPAGWNATFAPGARAQVVDAAVVSPADGALAVELTDDSASARAELARPIPQVRQGSVSLEARVPTLSAAPLEVHLRTPDGTFLAAVRLASDGKASFNANPAGVGAFTSTAIDWVPGAWNQLRIDWFADGRFDAYLNGMPVAAKIPLAAAAIPGQVKAIAGFAEAVGRVGFVDALTVTARPPLESIRGRYTENATFLSHAYVNTQTFVDLVPALCEKMRTQYRVRYLFVNVGLVDATGRLPNPSSSLSKVGALLDAVRACEVGSGYTFHVVAWLNGHTEDNTGKTSLDLSSAAVRAALVDESARFVAAAAPGSYVAGATRAFDGVQYDFEPSGGDMVRFGYFKQLLTEVRTRFADLGVPSRSIGVDAHKLGPSNDWWWTAQAYYEMAQVADQIMAMTYSTAIQDGASYQAWFEAQARDILRAVSGEKWGNDAAHPVPVNPVKVFLGMIAMRPTNTHFPAAENVTFASAGADAALTGLINAGERGPELFEGAAVYLHSDGTGNDGFAGYATDWWNFGRAWLGAW